MPGFRSSGGDARCLSNHTPMPDESSERILAAAWQRGLTGLLRTTDGRRLHVVYRGRCPGGAGPDVRAALLAFDDGVLLEGDVEFHRRTSDWFSHSHHDDPHYRSVILHVVLQADADPPRDPNGRPVPTLVVSRSELNDAGESLSVEDCHRRVRERSADSLVELIDRMGDRRLIEHAARVEADLTRLSPEQLAYQAVFDALGFSRNRTPFGRLAEAVPWARLLSVVGRRPLADALVVAQAILFGVAGLLPSQRPELASDWETNAITAELESVWGLYRQEWADDCLSVADWTFGGVRLANYPTRRIATAAYLVVRYRSVGLDQAFLAAVARPKAGPDLEKMFLVDERDDYWSFHADFGLRLPNGPAALLGHERARDAVVNVVFPFALAIAAFRDDWAFGEAVWDLFRDYPRPTVYQATRALATEIGVADRLVRTARRQQGLLYLQRRHCERAACLSCPLAAGAPARAEH